MVLALGAHDYTLDERTAGHTTTATPTPPSRSYLRDSRSPSPLLMFSCSFCFALPLLVSSLSFSVPVLISSKQV